MRKKDNLTPAERFQLEITALDQDIERLKTSYEQYFRGIEKLEPQRLRKEVQRRILTTNPNHAETSVDKFRFRTLAQRFASYASYWDRMLAMIEDGTFRRDRVRSPQADHPVLRRRLQRMGDHSDSPPREVAKAENERDTPTERRIAAGDDSAPSPSASRDNSGLRELFEEYKSARRAVGDSPDTLTLESFERSIEKSRAAKLAKFGCDELDYQVKLRDGRVALVARPVFK